MQKNCLFKRICYGLTHISENKGVYLFLNIACIGSMSATWNCGEMSMKRNGLETSQPCATGSSIIYAWAKDAPALELPKGVGFR